MEPQSPRGFRPQLAHTDGADPAACAPPGTGTCAWGSCPAPQPQPSPGSEQEAGTGSHTPSKASWPKMPVTGHHRPPTCCQLQRPQRQILTPSLLSEVAKEALDATQEAPHPAETGPHWGSLGRVSHQRLAVCPAEPRGGARAPGGGSGRGTCQGSACLASQSVHTLSCRCPLAAPAHRLLSLSLQGKVLRRKWGLGDPPFTQPSPQGAGEQLPCVQELMGPRARRAVCVRRAPGGLHRVHWQRGLEGSGSSGCSQAGLGLQTRPPTLAAVQTRWLSRVPKRESARPPCAAHHPPGTCPSPQAAHPADPWGGSHVTRSWALPREPCRRGAPSQPGMPPQCGASACSPWPPPQSTEHRSPTSRGDCSTGPPGPGSPALPLDPVVLRCPGRHRHRGHPSPGPGLPSAPVLSGTAQPPHPMQIGAKSSWPRDPPAQGGGGALPRCKSETVRWPPPQPGWEVDPDWGGLRELPAASAPPPPPSGGRRMESSCAD